MKFNIDAAQFKKAIGAMNRIAPKIIGSVLFVVDEDSNVVLKTIGDSIYLEYNLGVKAQDSINVAVGVSSLAVLSGFNGMVDFSSTDKMVVLKGSMSTRLNQFSVDRTVFDRPAGMPDTGWFDVGQDFRRVTYASGDPNLARDAIHIVNGYAVCSDYIRLSMTPMPGATENFSIRSDFFARLDTGEGLSIALSGNKVWVKSGPLLACFPTYAAQHPAIVDVVTGKIGKIAPRLIVTVERDATKSVFENMGLLSITPEDRSGVCEIMFEKSQLHISTKGNQLGSGEAKVECVYHEGDEDTANIIVAPKYVLDAMRNSSPTFKVGVVDIHAGNVASSLFTVLDEKTTHLIMPKVYVKQADADES